MCKMLLLLFVSVFHMLSLSAQQKSFPFYIRGQINADTGIVKLTLVADSSLYPKEVLHLNAKVLSGKFLIKGTLPYPLGFYLEYGKVYMSDRIIVEPGLQSVTVNIDSNYITPLIDNLSMKEYQNEYQNAYKDLKSKDSYADSDRILLKYVAAHPNSYLAFWNLARLLNFGYQNIFDDIYSKFSDSIKSTPSGRLLKQKLLLANVLGEGKKFPDFKCIDKNNHQLNSALFSKNQYTLIDFWYSGCGPCIALFPKLSEIYGKYGSKGFGIVAISVDKEKDGAAMENVINKYKLQWPQYWDLNGIESSKLSINAFPKKFLLNKEGVIIGQDLGAAELDDFLLKNLK